MGRLPRPTGKEMLRFLERRGFICVRITGSHHHMEKGHLRCPVPVHGNDDLKTGTLRSILRMIEMEPEEFEKLWNE
ncbi:type II toxin-antitoxin system HicA family toxin [Candidatus Peregrinibacteria bacterium]|nr:type II toxin-antitoxin system HicA family toxin [Candidatus Peregrinibacteria bacterium]MBI3816184.1 type II toxin-antitoxin system HicA family toxin [Candidatus Peregrinibacteria bacterium]